MKLLKLDKMPDLRVACVKGLIEIHERQCNALILPTAHQVRQGQDYCLGWAYRVQNEQEENWLRYFKTDYFSVVRCTMTLSAKGTFGYPLEVHGLTFVYTRGEKNLPIYELIAYSIHSRCDWQ